MKTYKILKLVAYQDKAGRIKSFPVGQQITSKDLLNDSQEKAFVNDGFIEIVKAKGKGKTDA